MNKINYELFLVIMPVINVITKPLRSKILSKNLEIQIYQSLIKPVIAYGLETWMLWKTDKNLLTVFESYLEKYMGHAKM